MRNKKFISKKRTRSQSANLDQIQVKKTKNTHLNIRNRGIKKPKKKISSRKDIFTIEKRKCNHLTRRVEEKPKENQKEPEIICSLDENKSRDEIQQNNQSQVVALAKVNALEFSLVGSTPNVCSICLEVPSFESRHFLRCGHMFHEVCIDNWLKRSNYCPNCKKNVYPDSGQYQNLLAISERMSDEQESDPSNGHSIVHQPSNSQLNEIENLCLATSTFMTLAICFVICLMKMIILLKGG